MCIRRVKIAYPLYIIVSQLIAGVNLFRKNFLTFSVKIPNLPDAVKNITAEVF